MFIFFAAQIPEDSFSEVTGLLDGVLEVFQFLWDMGHTFVSAVFGLAGYLFPFLPAHLTNAFSIALVVALVVGVIRFVRGS